MSEPFVGEIKLVGFPFAPRGYASCNGAIVAVTQNAALFSLLGANFGGNGQTTFGLPDLQGRVAVGQGQGLGLAPAVIGVKAGVESVTLTNTQLPTHTHTIAGTVTVSTTIGTVQVIGNQTRPNGNRLATGVDAGTSTLMKNYSDVASDGTLAGVASTASAALVNSNAGLGQPFSIAQPFQVANYIIATSGLFPSRN